MDGDLHLMTRPQLPPAIERSRVVVVARRLPPSVIDRLAALADGLVLEITMDGPSAADDIARIRSDAITVGAGPILDIAGAERALDAGAEFLVAPHLDERVVEWAAARDVSFVAGAMTPTEAVRAWAAGAAAVKVFPASVVGPRFVREMRGPLGHIPLVPTGGISAENARDFIAAGAVAVGVGSWLTQSPDLIADRWSALAEAVAVADR